MEYPLQVRYELLPQVDVYKYLKVLFMGEGRVELDTDRQMLYCCGDERAELESKAVELQVSLLSPVVVSCR